jgi:peptide/nickel transport system permease protein
MSVTHDIATQEARTVGYGEAAEHGAPEAAILLGSPDRVGAVVRYLRRNPSLVIGFVMLLSLVLFSGVGALLVDTERARPLSARAIQPPSWELPFGSDRQGRDLLAVMIAGTPLTLRIGLIAGFIGVGLGTVLAFISAYYGGVTDAIIRGIVDVGLTVPGLLVLIILAVTIRQGITVNQMALVVACLAWLYPTRVIRSQVLTMRERAWVQVARLSGMSGPEIIVKELLPNLFPFLAAALVNAISAAVLASIGLEALGLGPIESPTLGMTVYWVLFNAALINGWWWWWAPPIVILFILFVGLFLVSVGLDEIANPRLRRSV